MASFHKPFFVILLLSTNLRASCLSQRVLSFRSLPELIVLHPYGTDSSAPMKGWFRLAKMNHAARICGCLWPSKVLAAIRNDWRGNELLSSIDIFFNTAAYVATTQRHINQALENSGFNTETFRVVRFPQYQFTLHPVCVAVQRYGLRRR